MGSETPNNKGSKAYVSKAPEQSTIRHLIPNLWALICLSNSLHYSGILDFCKILSARICSHSATRASVRSGLAHSHVPGHPYWMELRSKLCAGQSNSSTPNWPDISLQTWLWAQGHVEWGNVFNSLCHNSSTNMSFVLLLCYIHKHKS